MQLILAVLNQSVLNDRVSIPLIFYFSHIVLSSFCLTDEEKTTIVVTVYNLAQGKGVIIGDTVAIPEPFVTFNDFSFQDKVRHVFLTPLLAMLFQKDKNRLSVQSLCVASCLQ